MTNVYGEMSQEELDCGYDAAAAVKNVSGYFHSWQTRSSAVREKLRCGLDIPYGPSSGQTLDIFFSRLNNGPIQIFFHGGYWRSQDKANFSYLAEPFVAAGANVVVPNYDLCPAVTLHEIVRQCQACVSWVYRHAAVFGADRNHIAVYGHSAGGHIAACLLTTDWSEYPGTPECVIKAATAVSGLFDLEPLRLSFLNADLRLDANQVRKGSPRYQFLRARVPFAIVVGGEETSEFIRQSRDYAALLGSRNYDASLYVIDGFNHYDILEAALNSSTDLGRTLIAQLFGPETRR